MRLGERRRGEFRLNEFGQLFFGVMGAAAAVAVILLAAWLFS